METVSVDNPFTDVFVTLYDQRTGIVYIYGLAFKHALGGFDFHPAADGGSYLFPLLNDLMISLGRVHLPGAAAEFFQKRFNIT